MRGGSGGERFLDAGEELGPIAFEKIKSARFDQALDDFAIGDTRVDPAAEILEGGEVAAALPLRDRGSHRAFADVLDRGESVTDRACFDRIRRVAQLTGVEARLPG